jgi:hypothetical protein
MEQQFAFREQTRFYPKAPRGVVGLPGVGATSVLILKMRAIAGFFAPPV